jgi:anti-sigma factor RsiW
MNRHESCQDKGLLASYLYNDCSDAERRVIEEHLAECAACASELEELRSVRSSLSQWKVPDRELGFRIVSRREERPMPVVSRRMWTPPWWLQTAAAVLLFATAAGLAQIEVRYAPDGLVVRTGWSRPVVPAPARVTEIAPGEAPWRQDLAWLKQALLSPAAQPTAAVPRPASQNEEGLLRRVQTLIDQSEQKQRRELAMRLADVVRDVEIQRRADQMRVQQTFGQLEGQTGIAVRDNRELLDYLVRVSQQR